MGLYFPGNAVLGRVIVSTTPLCHERIFHAGADDDIKSFRKRSLRYLYILWQIT